jgi:hypothetical protein
MKYNTTKDKTIRYNTSIQRICQLRQKEKEIEPERVPQHYELDQHHRLSSTIQYLPDTNDQVEDTI